jgi:D-alanyl-D-alanine dipeptidase
VTPYGYGVLTAFPSECSADLDLHSTCKQLAEIRRSWETCLLCHRNGYVLEKTDAGGNDEMLKTTIKTLCTSKSLPIPDGELMKIKTRRNSEELTSVKNTCPGVVINIDPESRQLQHLGKDECYLRKGVAERLRSASQSLPSGVRLMIWDAYRSVAAREKMHARYVGELTVEHPFWSEARIMELADKFIANPRKICLHATGGVVDVTLCDDSGKVLEMGSPLDSFNKESETNSEFISDAAKENRTLLKRCLNSREFVNYPPEWWHWSYGDSYWAAAMEREFAEYGYVEEQKRAGVKARLP